MTLDLRALGLAVLLCFPALGAAAQPARFGTATEPPPRVALGRFDGGYATQLAGAYLAGPTVGLALAIVHPVVGLSFFALAAPSVHAAHGNGLAAALAVIGPTAATLSGFFFAAALQTHCDSGYGWECHGLPVLAGLIGYTSWAVIDIVVHARRPHAASAARAAVPALLSF